MTPTLAVDFDGVISEYNGWKGLGAFGNVFKGCREELQKLRDAGWLIIIFTTRGLDIKAVEKFLIDNSIPFDLINRNAPDAPDNASKAKVLANVYLDDRAINFDGSWSGVADKVMSFAPHYLRKEAKLTTIGKARELSELDLKRLEEANRERADAWRNVGAGGLFLDLRKQYLRCRSFIWERLLSKDPICCDKSNPQHERWRIKSIDILRDLRSYAMFLQMLLSEDSYDPKADSEHWSERAADYLEGEQSDYFVKVLPEDL